MSFPINSSLVATFTRANRAPGPLVHMHEGQPVTDSLAIAYEFRRPHKNVLQSLDRLILDGEVSRLDFKPRDYTDGRGKKQRLIELSERGALIAMPFIGGRNSRAGQVRLVDAFLSMRTALAKASVDWPESRKAASVGYAMMCDALQQVRADNGKATSPHHYANEAKLVSWVLFGRFESINRDELTYADLALLEKIEARNAIWIARGHSYEGRKEALSAYAQSLRPQVRDGSRGSALGR